MCKRTHASCIRGTRLVFLFSLFSSQFALAEDEMFSLFRPLWAYSLQRESICVWCNEAELWWTFGELGLFCSGQGSGRMSGISPEDAGSVRSNPLSVFPLSLAALSLSLFLTITETAVHGACTTCYLHARAQTRSRKCTCVLFCFFCKTFNLFISYTRCAHDCAALACVCPFSPRQGSCSLLCIVSACRSVKPSAHASQPLQFSTVMFVT